MRRPVSAQAGRWRTSNSDQTTHDADEVADADVIVTVVLWRLEFTDDRVVIVIQ